MAKNKNAKRKARRTQLAQLGLVVVENKFELLKCVGRLWGKELHSDSRVLDNAGPGGANLHEITVAFDEIPFIVLGCKGVGPNLKEAQVNAAYNFVSFFDNGFIPKSSVNNIRTKWCNSTREIAEIVNVCRTIELLLKSDTYAGLQQVPLLVHDPPEKPWAKQLRTEVKASLKRNESNCIQPVNDKPSIFSEAGQKRRLQESNGSVSASASTSSFAMREENDDGAPSTKKARISTGSGSSADDPVVIDMEGVDSCEAAAADCMHNVVNINQTEGNREIDSDSDDSDSSFDENILDKVNAADVSLNISSSSLRQQTENDIVILEDTVHRVNGHINNHEVEVEGTVVESNGILPWNLSAKDAYGGHDSIYGWCKANNVPVDYEQPLIGVEYCGLEGLHDQIKMYSYKYKKQMKRFDDDIWRHYTTNGQTNEIFSWKMGVREKLLNEFKTAFPYQSISLYAVGSTINGCGSYNSDMDLCLCVPREGTLEDYCIGRDAEVKCLRKLSGLMKGKPALRSLIKKCVVVPAKVPIIKVDMHRPYEELDLDININNVAGIYNSHLIHYYSKLDSRFPSLCLLVKHWAINNGISDAMTGTFNSYSLILLVLHYLQCGVKPAILPNLQYLFPSRFADMPSLTELRLHEQVVGLPKRPVNVSTCAELLIGFFHYYNSFDFHTYAISVRNAKRFPRSAMPADTRHFLIYVEEPFDGKNTARCITKIHCMRSIEKAFARASKAFSTQPPLLASIDVNV